MTKRFSQLFAETWNRLKGNWILLVPPACAYFSMGLLFLFLYGIWVLSVFLFAPFAHALERHDTETVIRLGIFVGCLFFLLVGFIFGITLLLTAGLYGMTRNITITGKTTFKDFWPGIPKYFWRLLGGTILFWLIFLALSGLIIGPFLWLTLRIQPPLYETAMLPFVFGAISIFLLWVLVLTLIDLFLVMWPPALVLEEISVIRAFSRSFQFVWRNFIVILGLYGARLGATLALSVISFMPFIGNLIQLGAAVFLLTYFTLLYFITYQDRTKGL